MIANVTLPKSAVPMWPRLATTALFLANGFGIGSWAASIAPIKGALGLSDGQLGFALLAFAVGAIVTMTVAGHMAARFGSARVALGTSFAFAVALPLPGLAPGFVTLLLGVFALGGCNGAMDVAMNGHGTLVERAWGRPIMSSLHAAFSLGCLLGSGCGSGLLGLGYGALANLATAGGLALILTLLAMPNLRVPGVADIAASPAPGFVLPSRTILHIGLLAFLCMFAEGAVGDWSAVYLVTAAGTSTAIAALGFSGFAFAMTIGRLAGDHIVHRLGGARVLRLGAGLAAAGLALTLLVPRIDVALLGYAMAGLGIANIVPVLFSAAGRRMGDHPGIGVAMAATCGYSGFLISPPLVGIAANAVGLRFALILLVVAIATVTILARGVQTGPVPGPKTQ